jgi:hypothetical protein
MRSGMSNIDCDEKSIALSKDVAGREAAEEAVASIGAAMGGVDVGIMGAAGVVEAKRMPAPC